VLNLYGVVGVGEFEVNGLMALALWLTCFTVEVKDLGLRVSGSRSLYFYL